MTRIARVVVPGIPHHIVQRGNRRQQVFFSDDDRRFYLRLLKKHAAEAGITYWAYCLMENHVHLIGVPQKQDSFAKGIGTAHRTYTLLINIREDWRGYLWQGRFFSCPLDGPYLLAAIRYVECNPVRAGLVRRAEDYSWSSAAFHVFQRQDPLVERSVVQDEIQDWARYLTVPVSENEMGTLRQNTRTGRPAGDQGFVAKLERATERTLFERKRGPKPRLGHPSDFGPAGKRLF